MILFFHFYSDIYVYVIRLNPEPYRRLQLIIASPYGYDGLIYVRW